MTVNPLLHYHDKALPLYLIQEKDDELCKFVQQYEEQLAELKAQHEAHIKELEASWKTQAEKMVQQRESQLQEEMNGLTQEWTKERRVRLLCHVMGFVLSEYSSS